MKPSALAAALLPALVMPSMAAERGCFKEAAAWLDQAAADAEARYGVSVTCGPSSGSKQYLLVADGDGTPLGALDAYRDEAAAAVAKRLSGMLSLGREKLKSLTAAHEALLEDMRRLDAEYHVDAGFPTALANSVRYPDNQAQLLGLGMPDCSGGGYQSTTPLGRLAVKVSEYLPGRDEYGDDSIYKKGDLQVAFAADAGLQASYAARVKALTSDNQCLAYLQRAEEYSADRMRAKLGPDAKITSWDELRQKYSR